MSLQTGLAWLALLVFWCTWVMVAIARGFSRGFFWGRREPLLLFVAIRVLVAASVAGLLGGLLWPAVFLPVLLPSSRGLPWMGLLLVVAGSGLFAWVGHALGRQFSTSLHVRDDHRLVMTGPYAWVRHPMYIAYQTVWCGFLLVTGNVVAGLCGVLAFVLAMIWRVRAEEAMLAETFGEQWQQYCRQTGRYLPRAFQSESK